VRPHAAQKRADESRQELTSAAPFAPPVTKYQERPAGNGARRALCSAHWQAELWAPLKLRVGRATVCSAHSLQCDTQSLFSAAHSLPSQCQRHSSANMERRTWSTRSSTRGAPELLSGCAGASQWRAPVCALWARARRSLRFGLWALGFGLHFAHLRARAPPAPRRQRSPAVRSRAAQSTADSLWRAVLLASSTRATHARQTDTLAATSVSVR